MPSNGLIHGDRAAQARELQRLIASSKDQNKVTHLQQRLHELESIRPEPPSSTQAPVVLQKRFSSRFTRSEHPAALCALDEHAESDIMEEDTKHVSVEHVISTCFDLNHNAASILSARQLTFWISTGLFPQQLILFLGKATPLKSLELTFRHIRSLRVYTYHHQCVWKHIALATLEIPYEAKNHLNVQNFDIKGFEAVDIIIIQIYTAYRDFVKVYNVHINELNT